MHTDRPLIHHRKWLVPVAAALIGLVVLLSVLPLQVYQDWAFVCENTGSQKGYRQWWVGLRSAQWYQESRLEDFMRREHPSDLTYRWTCYRGTGKNLFGRPLSFGHSYPQVGEIIMRQSGFNTWVDALDDGGKLDLYRLLASGDRDAIRAKEAEIGYRLALMTRGRGPRRAR